jgi:hypothetical protein
MVDFAIPDAGMKLVRMALQNISEKQMNELRSRAPGYRSLCEVCDPLPNQFAIVYSSKCHRDSTVYAKFSTASVAILLLAQSKTTSSDSTT